MAIKITMETTAKGKPLLAAQIDNGDLEALRNVMDQYGFVNEEALIRYALVSLLRSSDNQLYVRQGVNILAMKIADSLLKKKESDLTATALKQE